MESGRAKVEKLNGTNWAFWKVKAKAAFVLEGLWDIISGECREPEMVGPAPSTTADREAWKLNDSKALAVLTILMEDSQLVQIMGCETSNEAWETLREHYEQQSLQNVVFHQREYRDCRWQEGQSMLSHINKHKMKCQTLAAIGAPVDERTQIQELILTVPKEYDTVVTSMQALGKDLTLEKLTSQLLLEEQKQEQRDAGVSTSAMYSAKARVGASGCSEHQAAKEHQVGQEVVSLRSKVGKVLGRRRKARKGCFKCGSFDHFKRDCPDINAAHANKNVGNPASLLVGSTVNSRDKWFVDSGASQHMCCSEEFYAEFKQFSTPQKVSLPDGNVLRMARGVERCYGRTTSCLTWNYWKSCWFQDSARI